MVDVAMGEVWSLLLGRIKRGERDGYKSEDTDTRRERVEWPGKSEKLLGRLPCRLHLRLGGR